MSKHNVTQELVFLSTGDDGAIRYRVEHHPLPSYRAPDVHIRKLLGWDEDAPAGALLHSTSWRYDLDTNAVILTWTVIPDPNPESGETRDRVEDIAQGTTGTHPFPDGLTSDHAAAHAIRHTSFLLHTDEVVEDELHHFPALHDALLAYAPDVARGHHA